VDQLVERLTAQYDTLVTPGRFFGAPGHFRIGWGVDRAVLNEGLRRLGEGIGEL
jgi:aspartate/methionine/tyrosine aminotransferase